MRSGPSCAHPQPWGPCQCCTDRFLEERRREDQDRLNPNRGRPAVIRRLWADLRRRTGDPAQWNGPLMQCAVPQRVRLSDPADIQWGQVKCDTAEFRYFEHDYGTHRVKRVSCEGITVWERTTPL